MLENNRNFTTQLTSNIEVISARQNFEQKIDEFQEQFNNQIKLANLQ